MPATRLPSQPWYSSINFDLFLKVLKNSIFHPFVASLLPLCLRAAETPYSEPAFKNSVYWAIFICLIHAFGPLNEKIAFGAPRTVDHEEETIVITGGASGLGRCLAEVYAMNGTAVAVIDVKPERLANPTTGIKYYECDVGNRGAVKKVWAQIVKDVRLLALYFLAYIDSTLILPIFCSHSVCIWLARLLSIILLLIRNL